MHKQFVKEVQVRNVMFKDIVPSVNVKLKNSIDVEASKCANPCKIVVGQHDDAQNNDAQHNDVENDDAQNDVSHAQPDGIQVQE